MPFNTLPVSRVVNVSVEMSPKAAALRNFGAMLVIGDSDVIDTTERLREYSLITEVADDFGTEAPEYLAALAFFSQSPQPKNLLIGRWAKSATSGRVNGRILSTSEQEIDLFTEITAGAISLKIDGVTKSLTAINLSSESNLNGVAAQVTSALGTSGTCSWTGSRFVITSATTGNTSSVTAADASDLATLMGLVTGTKSVNGVTAETISEAINALLDYQSWYGAFIASTYSITQAIDAAALISAAEPARIIAFTSQDTDEIDATNTTSLGYKLKALGYNRCLVMYSSETAYAAMSVLGRMATVNFEGANTTITLKFKQCPGVVAENLTTSQANAAKAKNVNLFAAYQNDTSILQEGVMSGGWYIDEIHGLDWLQNRVQTDLYNLLYTSTTKVGQDDAGATTLVSTVNRSLDQAVRNGLVAPGVWNGSPVGSLATGDTLAAGYYVYIQPMSEQSQSNREARIAPPIQAAIKLKGAIHFVDCTITVNR